MHYVLIYITLSLPADEVHSIQRIGGYRYFSTSFPSLRYATTQLPKLWASRPFITKTKDTQVFNVRVPRAHTYRSWVFEFSKTQGERGSRRAKEDPTSCERCRALTWLIALLLYRAGPPFLEKTTVGRGEDGTQAPGEETGERITLIDMEKEKLFKRSWRAWIGWQLETMD